MRCGFLASFGLVFLWCLLGPTALAYQATLESVEVPYEVATIPGDPQIEQSLLGELNGYPEMYEITSDTDFTLTVEIRAVPSASTPLPELSGIIVHQKDKRGVEEVARLKAHDAAWNVLTDTTTGLRYQSGPFYSEKVPAGTYRIEISTLENSGKYMLVIGNTAESLGYFATLDMIATTYGFYGLAKIRMFSSPYVHYPVGIIFLVVVLSGIWYWRKRHYQHV